MYIPHETPQTYPCGPIPALPAPMPYGFYSLIRFVTMIAFPIYAYVYYEKKSNKLAILFLSLAILFQPLLPIYLGRTLWNIIDVIVAIFLIFLYIKENKSPT